MLNFKQLIIRLHPDYNYAVPFVLFSISYNIDVYAFTKHKMFPFVFSLLDFNRSTTIEPLERNSEISNLIIIWIKEGKLKTKPRITAVLDGLTVCEIRTV